MGKLLGFVLGSIVGFVLVTAIVTSTTPVVSPLSNEELSNYFETHGTTHIATVSFEKFLTTQALGQVAGTFDIATKSASSDVTNAPKALTIGLLGDSMIDTLGADLPHMRKTLTEKWPTTSFTLLNYGAGATNVESGLDRLVNETTYLGITRPPLLSRNLDIIVVESFAYNHWDNDQAGLDRQWIALTHIVETIKNHNPNIKIVLANTIAPYCPTYTNGSANLPTDRKFIECQTVIAYLKNMENFAHSTRLPFANVFATSLKGAEGNPQFINSGDHIHPSDKGKQLFAQEIAKALEQIIADMSSPVLNDEL